MESQIIVDNGITKSIMFLFDSTEYYNLPCSARNELDCIKRSSKKFKGYAYVSIIRVLHASFVSVLLRWTGRNVSVWVRRSFDASIYFLLATMKDFTNVMLRLKKKNLKK